MNKNHISLTDSTNEFPFGEMTKSKVIFSVPYFQRQYVWSAKQQTELHEDIISLVEDIDVIHLKKYSFSQLLLTDFKRSAALTKVILRERKLDNNFSGKKTSVPLSFQVGVIFPPLVTLLLILLLISRFIFLIPIFVLFSFLMILFNIKFLHYLAKKKGFVFLFKSMLFLHIDYFFVDFGIICGIVSFLSGRRY